MRHAHRLLDQIEALWRGRFARIQDRVRSLAEPSQPAYALIGPGNAEYKGDKP